MWDAALWTELLLVLGLGTALVVVCGELAGFILWGGAAQRLVWQAALLGLVVLTVSELTGVGPAVVGLWSAGSGGTAKPDERASVVSDAPFEEELLPHDGLWEFDSAELEHRSGIGVSKPSEIQVAPPPHRRDAGATFVDATERAATGAESIGGRATETRATDAVAPPTSLERGEWLVLDRTSLWPAVAWTWLVGCAVLWLRTLGGRAWWAWRGRRCGEVREADLLRRAGWLAERMGLSARVRLVEVPGLFGPVAFGIARPTVGLPADFCREFSPAEQEAVLAHELAHLRGRDPQWQLAADLVTALLWWHPAAWHARSRLRAACELAADEASLLVADGPHLLATCLVKLGRRLAARRHPAWARMAGGGRASSLARRVRRLVELDRIRPWRPRRTAAVLLRTVGPVVLVLTAALSTAWARPGLVVLQEESTMTKAKMSWKRSLAGVAVLAVLGTGLGFGLAEDQKERERDRPAAGDRGDDEGERPRARRDGEDRREEGERRRDGDRERGERRDGEPRRERDREGDRERDADRPREGDRRDREREGDRERDGDRPRREGDERRFERDRPHPELAAHLHRLEERLHDIRREIPELLEQGKRDAAEALEQEAREISEQLQRHRHPDRPRGELERRVHHLRVAIENLEAAGLHDAAHSLARQLERMHDELGERRHPEREHRPGPPHELIRVVHELREHMERMNRELAELRGRVNRLSGEGEREPERREE